MAGACCAEIKGRRRTNARRGSLAVKDGHRAGPGAMRASDERGEIE